MKIIHIIMMVLFLSIMTGCSTPLALEDLVEATVYFPESDENLIAVDTLTREDGLDDVFIHLVDQPVKAQSIKPDLIYLLDLDTLRGIMQFDLSFDLTNKEARAQNINGTYVIPFEWVDMYLEKLPILNHFSYLMPSTPRLVINDTTIDYAYNQDWKLHPTDNVTYDIKDQTTHHETYYTETDAIDISIEFNRRTPNQLLLAIDNGKEETTYTLDNMHNLPVPDQSGHYTYTLMAVWDDASLGYTGKINYIFGLDLHLEESLHLNKTTFEPGDSIGVLIEQPFGLDYRIETPVFKNTIGIFNYEDALVALVPIDSRTTPGTYSLSLYEASTNTLIETIQYQIVEKIFETQQLSVSASTASLRSDENAKKDAEKFKNAKTYSVGEKLWDGPFVQPVEGRISTEYSVIRYVNSGTESSRHTAIDIAAPQGTPIKAAHNGIVTFSSDLIISGNVVVLDHGLGLFTTYVHMHKIYVEDGQEVKKGDIIGEVGTTGYSTGPHLHFAVSKSGVNLNPWKFMAEDPLIFPTWNKTP